MIVYDGAGHIAAAVRYSLLHREVETEILPHCQSEWIGVIVYSPMASGLLTGAMNRDRIASLPKDDWRKGHSDFNETESLAPPGAGRSLKTNRAPPRTIRG